MPQAIPEGLSREHVLRALAELDAGTDYPFGEPTGYVVLHDGRRYPSKAVVNAVIGEAIRLIVKLHGASRFIGHSRL